MVWKSVFTEYKQSRRVRVKHTVNMNSVDGFMRPKFIEYIFFHSVCLGFVAIGHRSVAVCAISYLYCSVCAVFGKKKQIQLLNCIRMYVYRRDTHTHTKIYVYVHKTGYIFLSVRMGFWCDCFSFISMIYRLLCFVNIIYLLHFSTNISSTSPLFRLLSINR